MYLQAFETYLILSNIALKYCYNNRYDDEKRTIDMMQIWIQQYSKGQYEKKLYDFRIRRFENSKKSLRITMNILICLSIFIFPLEMCAEIEQILNHKHFNTKSPIVLRQCYFGWQNFFITYVKISGFRLTESGYIMHNSCKSMKGLI